MLQLKGSYCLAAGSLKVPFPVRQEALASAELIETRQAASLVTVHTGYSSPVWCWENGVTALGINLAPGLPVYLVLNMNVRNDLILFSLWGRKGHTPHWRHRVGNMRGILSQEAQVHVWW